MIDGGLYDPGERVSVILDDGRSFSGGFMNVDWAEDNESGMDELCIYCDDGTCRSFREDEIESILKR